jgi:hypothetical protein
MIAHFARVLIVGTASVFLGILPVQAQKEPSAKLVKGSIKFDKAQLPTEISKVSPGSKVLGEDWYSIEVKFDTTEDFTEEITVKFYTDMIDTLKEGNANTVVLTSETTFINVPKGNGHLATAYLHPSSILRYGGTTGKDGIKKANIHVELMENGRSAGPGEDLRPENQANWYTSFTQVPGVLLSLKDSPFWPYEMLKFNQIKSSTR